MLHLLLILALSVLAACNSRTEPPPGSLVYVAQTGPYQAFYGRDGKLLRVLREGKGRGKADLVLLFRPDGRPLLGQVDSDGDGVVDRWEYFAPGGVLEKVAVARRKPGKQDLWVYFDATGSVARRELDEDGDGRVDRTEQLADGRIARLDLDTNGDGKADRWQTFDGPNVITDLDTDGDGRPDQRLVRGPDGRVKVGPAPHAVAVAEVRPSQPQKKKADVLDVGTDKQLFIDSRFIESSEGITLTVNPPKRTEGHVLEADRPWEAGGLGFPFSVIFDSGRFYMWYEAQPATGPAWHPKVFYATSSDGIHWTKPELGLIAIRDSTANNCVFQARSGSTHGQCVFVDPSAPASERYKMIVGDFALEGAPLIGAYSSDGLRWTIYPQSRVVPQGADTQAAAFYDPRIGRYVAYTRLNVPPAPGKGIRHVGRTESEKFTGFPAAADILQADDRDPPYTGVYNMAATPYLFAQDVYLAFPSLMSEALGSRPIEAQLAVSRDGVSWERPSREPFLPVGPEGGFVSKMVFVTPGVQRVGDELWLYYAAYPVDHNTVSSRRNNGVVYRRARLRLDGFVSAAAGTSGGRLVTPPLVFGGNRLELNVDVAASGSATVALLDERGNPLPGFAGEEMDSFGGSHVAQVVSWRGNADLTALLGRRVKMEFRLRSAKLYAFQFTRR